MKSIYSILFLAVFLNSCVDQVREVYHDFNWLPEFAIPVGKVEFNLEEYPPEIIELYFSGSIPGGLPVQRDTLPFNFRDLVYGESRKVDSLVIYLDAVNSFPESVELELYFTDQYDFPRICFNNLPATIAAAEVDPADGSLVKPLEQKITLRVDEQGASVLENIENLVFSLTLGQDNLKEEWAVSAREYGLGIQLKAIVYFNMRL